MKAFLLGLACSGFAAVASARVLDTNASLPTSTRVLSAGQLGDAFQLLSQYSYGTIGECPDKFKLDIPQDAHASDGFYTVPYSSIKIDLGGWTFPSLNSNEFTGVECSGPAGDTELRLQRGEMVKDGTFVRDHAHSSSTLTLYESLSDRFPNGNYWTSPLTVAPFNCSKGGAWPETAWFREGFTFLFFREEDTVPITFIGKVRSDGTERLVMLNMTGTIRYMIASASQTTCIYRAMLDVERLMNETIAEEEAEEDALGQSGEEDGDAEISMSASPSVSLIASPSASSSASAEPSASSSAQPSLEPGESPSISPSVSASPSASASESVAVSESPSSAPTSSPVSPSCDCVCSPQLREREKRREERRKKRLEKIKPGGPWYGPAVPKSRRHKRRTRFPFKFPGFFKGNDTAWSWSWICCKRGKKNETANAGSDANQADGSNPSNPDGSGETKAEADDSDADSGVRAGSACFPGAANVETESGGKPMHLLEVGDKVLASGGKYSRVFLFTHREKDVESKFVQLVTKRGMTISLSPDHLIRTRRRGLIPAEHARVGDAVTSMGRKDEELADSIVRIERFVGKGLYNAHTEDGSIVVDGVLVSCYTKFLPASVAHALLMPVRVLSRVGLDPLGSMLDRGTDPLVEYYKSLPTVVATALALPARMLEDGAEVFKRIVIASDPWLQWA